MQLNQLQFGLRSSVVQKRLKQYLHGLPAGSRREAVFPLCGERLGDTRKIVQWLIRDRELFSEDLPAGDAR